MKIYEFYRKYANVPLSLRFTPLSFKDGGNTTLSDVYKEMNELEDKIRKLQSREEELMKLASVILDRVNAE